MKANSNYWNVSEFKLTYTNETKGDVVTANLNPTFVAPTPLYFSYHCYDPSPVRSVNSTKAGVAVQFLDLQVSYCTVCV